MWANKGIFIKKTKTKTETTNKSQINQKQENPRTQKIVPRVHTGHLTAYFQ